MAEYFGGRARRSGLYSARGRPAGRACSEEDFGAISAKSISAWNRGARRREPVYIGGGVGDDSGVAEADFALSFKKGKCDRSSNSLLDSLPTEAKAFQPWLRTVQFTS